MLKKRFPAENISTLWTYGKSVDILESQSGFNYCLSEITTGLLIKELDLSRLHYPMDLLRLFYNPAEDHQTGCSLCSWQPKNDCINLFLKKKKDWIILDLVVEKIDHVQWEKYAWSITTGWTNEIMILQCTYNSCDMKYTF